MYKPVVENPMIQINVNEDMETFKKGSSEVVEGMLIDLAGRLKKFREVNGFSFNLDEEDPHDPVYMDQYNGIKNLLEDVVLEMVS